MDHCVPDFLDEYPFAPDGDPPPFLGDDPVQRILPHPMEPSGMPDTRAFDHAFESDVAGGMEASVAAEVEMNDVAEAAQEDLAQVIDWLGTAAGDHPSVQNFLRQVELRLSGKPLSPALRNVVGVWQPAGTPAVRGGLAGTGQLTTGIEDFIPGVTGVEDVGASFEDVTGVIEGLVAVGMSVGQALQQLGIIDQPQQAVRIGPGQYQLPSGQVIMAPPTAPSTGFAGMSDWIIPIGLLAIGGFLLTR